MTRWRPFCFESTPPRCLVRHESREIHDERRCSVLMPPVGIMLLIHEAYNISHERIRLPHLLYLNSTALLVQHDNIRRNHKSSRCPSTGSWHPCREKRGHVRFFQCCVDSEVVLHRGWHTRPTARVKISSCSTRICWQQ